MPHGGQPRREVNRIERLRRRLRALSKYPSEKQRGEISALEWAIPILEKYVKMKHKSAPPARILYHKHEKKEIVSQLLERDGPECYLCEHLMPYNDMTIDHVIPLSKGGPDIMSNYKLAHELCNLEKADMTEGEYRSMKELERLFQT